ncbi:MAG: PAS domain-containing protein [Bacteroidales bacterium]|nr:PAS domain-containing protein [Bacteroidales bacterium]
MSLKKINIALLAIVVMVMALFYYFVAFQAHKTYFTQNLNETNRFKSELFYNLIRNHVEKYVEGARSISSRSMIKQKLIEYHQQSISFKELSEFTDSKFKDGIKALSDCKQGLRLTNQRIITSFGEVDSANIFKNYPDSIQIDIFTQSKLLIVSVTNPIFYKNKIIGYDFLQFQNNNAIPKLQAANFNIRIDHNPQFQADSINAEGIQTQWIHCPSHSKCKIIISIDYDAVQSEIDSFHRNQVYISFALIAFVFLIFITFSFKFKLNVADKTTVLNKLIDDKNKSLNSTVERLKKAQKELHDEKEKYRIVADYNYNWEYWIDKNNQFIYVSPSCESITGYSVKEFFNNPQLLNDIIYDEDKPIFFKHSHQLNEGYISPIEFRIVSKDGKIEWISHVCNTVKDYDGKNIGIRGSNKLITDQKNAETKLRQEEANFKAFFHTVSDFLWVLDKQGNIIDFNSTVLKRLKFEANELIGASVLKVHPQERHQEAINTIQAMLNGTKDICKIPLIDKNGVLIPVETIVYPGIWNENEVLFGVSKNISGLELSEEKFSKTFYNNPSICGLSDLETGAYIEVNHAFVEKLEFTETEIIGKTATELNIITTKSREKLHSQLEHKGYIKNTESILKTKSGKTLNVLLTAEILIIGGKKYNYTIATDISALKRAEQELFDSQMRWQFAIEGNKDGLWDWNLLTEDVFFSDRWKEMLGYAPNEIEHKLESWSTRVHPDDLNETFSKVNAHLEGKLPFYESEHRLFHRDGHYIWVLDRGKIVEYNNDGQATRMIGTHTDITSRKTNEEALAKSDAQLKLAQKTAKIGHWEYNYIDNKLSWSDETYRIFETNNKTFKGTLESFLSLIHPDDIEYVSKAYQESVEKNTEYNVVHRILLKNNTLKYVNEKCITTYDDKGNPLVSLGTIADISELVEKENIITLQNQELLKLNKTKDKMYAIIAHDLKGPYNAILGFSNLMQEAVISGDYSGLQTYSEQVNKVALQSFTLLTNLLHWSRLQSSQIEYKPNWHRLNEIVERITTFSESLLNNKNIQIQKHYNSSQMIFADDFILETILRNLINNAIKFSHPNSKITIDYLNDSRKQWFYIKDQGVGIDQKNIKKIFNNDEIHTTTGTNKEKGTGLGLMLCQEFVHIHKGEIKVESTLGVGSTFMFYLPCPKMD